jgi:shikimate 5-dehydrogenase
VLGAGGAARSAAIALAAQGSTVTVHARDEAKARVVASLVSGSTGPFPPVPASWDVLVNCTPVGLYPRVDQSPLPSAAFECGLVYDLIYNPTVTKLLHDAASAGCDTIGGLDMLVAQAQEQFEWWTGLETPAGVMRAAALKGLSEFNSNEDHVI